MKNAVVWFRNDLRLRDNAVLHLEAVKKAQHLVGVYCFDKRFENRFTRKFREQAVADLSRNFRSKYGVPLLVFEGKPEQVLPELVSRLDGPGTVVCSEEVTSYETKVDAKVTKGISAHGWKFQTAWTYSMYHPDDLPFNVRAGDLAEPFTVFRQKIESQKVPIQMPLLAPELKGLRAPTLRAEEEGLDKIPGFLPNVEKWTDPNYASFEEGKEGESMNCKVKGRHVLRFRGGEEAAQLRLETFCAAGLATYKKTRNGSIGWDYSSKLSPWLAAGCISARQIHHRIAVYEQQYGESVDTYWVTFELLWRDYMRFFAMKHGNKIFFETGPAGQIPKGVVWEPSESAQNKLEAWKKGLTGIPWVDAHMRELAETGFMSNRGRQNVASFLVHNLQVDWRLGAKYFEDTLIDHDVTANWCNWVMAAGVGFRSQRVNRFNMDKQARDYDKNGEHARLWIPELKVPPGKSPHDLALRPPVKSTTLDKWFSASATNQEALNRMGPYPMPIVKIIPSKLDGDKLKRNKRTHTGKNKTFYTN